MAGHPQSIPGIAAALFTLLFAAAASIDAASAQSRSPGDDALRPATRPGLDPWNANVRRLPKWDLQNSQPRLEPRARRHEEFIQAGVPVEYRSRRSPYPNAQMVIDEGNRLYRANCQGCHGPKGRGDGDAGLDLVPSPALLSHMMDVQGRVDEYLLWTISEGGKPFDTAMPAFKDRLTEDDIWKLVAFMRSGFPPLPQ